MAFDKSIVGISAESIQVKVFLALEEELLLLPQAASNAAEAKTVAPKLKLLENFIFFSLLKQQLTQHSAAATDRIKAPQQLLMLFSL
ncbi:hypothetical protein lacNasYZ03_05670 [Lactobacillus nasalidis]|uniref:Uncharacterized protein n=1 Tax=Lactobacillus nasalidis TaxID=2797258 RepID=A0ABQ3W674_9LACO|nr:hypothetical protein [Lactobacillus nasalidis]GHV97640.1 hypothetical protein lacNasYZ01_08220 [Lactobacillus nasalidis]GHV99567.1 hypothetical protein lacNasYZ02_09970 [Lactobacillus nasalidis]GHW00880.1 hypothetical protein lacNasYZ03_05670 [Lactobacillus nasalidis]